MSNSPEIKSARRRKRYFLDTAHNRITETLSLVIQGMRIGKEDETYCAITVHGSLKGTGIMSAEISNVDASNFHKFGVVYVVYKPTRELAGDKKKVWPDSHALFLVRNKRNQSCDLYDPNGTFMVSYPEAAKGIIKAVHRGLLRPLLDQSRFNPETPLSVSFQNQNVGLQLVENRSRASALGLLSLDTYQAVLGMAASRLQNYLSQDHSGFCVTWAIFRVVDNFDAPITLYNCVEGAFLYKQPEYSVHFKRVAQNLWFKQFKDDIGQSGDVDSHTNHMLLVLFDHMVLSIFTRILALSFVQNATSKQDLTTRNLWWPAPKRQTETFEDFLKRSIELIWFNTQHPEKSKGVLHVIEDLDINLKFGQMPGFAATRYIPYYHFPFPPKSKQGKRRTEALWKFEVDLDKPIRSTFSAKTVAEDHQDAGPAKRTRNAESPDLRDL